MFTGINSKKIDFLFSKNGDFVFEFGDIKDSYNLNGLGFIEEVELRIKSSQNDWYFDPEYGANLDRYVGQMINPSLIQAINESIRFALTYDDFLSLSNFSVDVQQIGINEVAVKVFFSDNIKKDIDYKIQDVKLVFDLKNAVPRIVR